MTTNPLSPLPPVQPTVGQGGGSARFTPVDPMRVLRQYARVLIITGVSGVILGITLWALLSYLVPVYETESQLEVSRGVNDPHQTGDPNEQGRAGMDLLKAYMYNQTLRIKSQEVLRDALDRPDVRDTSWFESFSDPITAREQLQDDLEAIAIRGSTFVSVKLVGRPADDLRVVLDGVIDIYLLKIEADRRSQDAELRQTFLREAEQAEELAKQLQDQMARFAEQHEIASLESRNNEAAVDYERLAASVSSAKLQRQAVHAAYQGLLEAEQQGVLLTASPETLMQVENAQAVAMRNEKLRALREIEAVLSESLGPRHRRIKQIRDQMQAAEQEKQQEVERLLKVGQQVDLERAKNAATSLDGTIMALGPELQAASGRMRDLERKLFEYRQLAIESGQATDRHLKAQEQLHDLRVIRDRPDSSRVRRVVHAIDPELVFPTVPIIVPGVTILVLVSVTGLIFAKETLDQRIKSPADVKMLPKVELLGVIPDVDEDPSGRDRIEGVVKELPDGLMAEAFRQMRSEVLSRMDRCGHKTLMLVGAQADCGVSALTNNLAVSLMHNRRKVLVLDANMRRPSQHMLFGTPQAPGLTDVLRDQISLDKAIVNGQEPGLAVLPAGQSGLIWPETFEGQGFRDLLAKLQTQFDLILVDAPPALIASESQLLTKAVDAVVVVVRAMGEKRGMVGRLLGQLGGQRADVLGVVLNRAQTSAGGYFRESYQAFYQYRDDQGAQRPQAVAAT